MVSKEKLDSIKERLRKENEDRRKTVIDYFNNMKPFTSIDNIPDIPITDPGTYKSIIVPNLIRCGAIPKNKLKLNSTYIGSCRNASEAVWNGERFIYRRTKFGYTYDEEINHFEDDDGSDLFVPIQEKS